MKKDEKEGLIGLAIIAAVLLVGGYFIYKIFFTYSSYSECVADRTMKSGMSDLQVVNQKKYCREYFAKKNSVLVSHKTGPSPMFVLGHASWFPPRFTFEQFKFKFKFKFK